MVSDSIWNDYDIHWMYQSFSFKSTITICIRYHTYYTNFSWYFHILFCIILICWMWSDIEIHWNYNNHLRKNKYPIQTKIEMVKCEEIYLLTPLKTCFFEIELIPGNESWTLHKYFFITNSGLYRNGLIL